MIPIGENKPTTKKLFPIGEASNKQNTMIGTIKKATVIKLFVLFLELSI